MIQEPQSTPKPLSITDFAKKLKAKYPQYQSIDDTELATRTLRKHPQYRTKVDAPANLYSAPSQPVAPYRTKKGALKYQPDTDWSLNRLTDVETEYQRRTGQKLPVSVRGQGDIHNKWNYAHEDSADIGLNPSSKEGQALLSQLQEQGVPFLAFDKAIPGASTGPHIHIGRPSKRRTPDSQAMSTTGRLLNPTPTGRKDRKLGPRQEGIVSLADSTGLPPETLAPVIESALQSTKQQTKQRDLQQKVTQARRVMQKSRGAFSGLKAGVQGQEEARSNIPDINQILTEARNSPEAQSHSEIRQKVIEEQQPGMMAGLPTIGTAADPIGTVTRGIKRIVDPEAQIQEEVNRRVEQLKRQQSPEMQAERKIFGKMSAPERAIQAPLTRFAGNITQAVGGVISLAGLAPNQASDYVNKRGQMLVEGATLPPLTQEGVEIERGIPEKVATALGDLGMTVFELAALKKATGLPMGRLMAAETALKTSDLPTEERAAAIAQSFAMGKVLEQHLGRTLSAGLFGGPTALQSAEALRKGEMSVEDALLQTGVQTGAGFILGGKGVKAVPKQMVDYTMKSPITPEPVRDVVANVMKFGKGLIRSKDGRNMSLYADAKTGEVYAKEITPEQAKQYDPTIVTGEKRSIRNAKEVSAEDYDLLARTLNVETKTPRKQIEGIAPEIKVEKEIKREVETKPNVAAKPEAAQPAREPQPQALDEAGKPRTERIAQAAAPQPDVLAPVEPIKAETEVIQPVPAVTPSPIPRGLEKPAISAIKPQVEGVSETPSIPQPPENVQWMPDTEVAQESGREQGQAARAMGLEITENPYRRVAPEEVERFKPLAEEWEAGWNTQTPPSPETLRVELNSPIESLRDALARPNVPPERLAIFEKLERETRPETTSVEQGKNLAASEDLSRAFPAEPESKVDRPAIAGEGARPFTNRKFIHETEVDFDKFDLNKAGSGQGEQWYGRGAYLQEQGTFKLESYGSKKREYKLPSNAKVLDESQLLPYVQRKGLLSERRQQQIATYTEETLPKRYSLSEGQDGKFIVWDNEADRSITLVPSAGKKLALKKAYNEINGINTLLGGLTPRDIFKDVGAERLVSELKRDGYDGFYNGGELVVYRPERLVPAKTEQPSSGKVASPPTLNAEKSLAPEPKVSEQPIKEVKDVIQEAEVSGEPKISGKGTGEGPLETVSPVLSNEPPPQEPPTELDLPKGEKERSLPKTLDMAGLESGPTKGYTPETLEEGVEYGKKIVDEKGLDGAMEFVRTGDGIEWASTGFEASAQLRAEESRLRAEGKTEEADSTQEKRFKFLDDFALAAVERGRSIVGIKAISHFAPDRMAYMLNKASLKKRKRGISPEEDARIAKLGEELGALEDRNKALEKALETAKAQAKKRAPAKGKKKSDYQSRLDEQAESILVTLKPKVGKFDFAGLGRSSEKGALTVGIPPLPGDAELLAQYTASQLSKLDTVTALNEHLLTEFGQEIEPYLPKIRQRAYAIRHEARLAEIESNETEPKRRRTILDEIQKEISASLTAIREAQKTQERTVKAERAEERKTLKAEARKMAKQAREDERERQKQIIKEARADLKRLREESKQASKAETQGYRDTIRVQREAERRAALWDTPLRNEAREARERLQTATDPKDPQVMEDLTSVAAEKFLPDEIGGQPRKAGVEPAKVYKDLKDEFPSLVTKKNQAEIYKRGYQRIQDMTAAAREAARMRSASAESKRLWDELGINIDAQAVLIKQAEVRRQTDELRRKAVAEFDRVSRTMLEKAWMEAQAIPRSLMSSIDAPLGRQGVFFLLTHPITAGKAAIPATLKGYGSINVADYIKHETDLTKHPDYDLAIKSKLDLSQTSGTADPSLVAEEQFQSPLAAKIFPHVRLSEQGYVLGMNAERLAMFSRLAALGRSEGYTSEANQDFFDQAAKFINDGTGRGTLPDFIKRASSMMNFFFFSTRLNISRLQLLNDLFNPVKYVPESKNPFRAIPGLGSYDPVMRKIMAKELLRLGAALTTIYLLAQAMGVGTEFDPDDSDAFLLRVRNTRYDITGGEAGTVRFLYRLLTSIYKTANGEDLSPFEEPLAITGKFLRYKLAPFPSGVIDATTGKDAIGQPANLTKFDSPKQALQENVILRRTVPILTGNLIDTVSQEGWIGLPMAAPAFAGFGVSSYPDRGIRAIKNQKVVDVFEELKITSQSLIGQKTKDDELDEAIQKRILDRVENLNIPEGTDIGKETLIREQLNHIRTLAKAETAIAEPERYKDYLINKAGSETFSFLTDAERAKLTEADVKRYRTAYADAYLTILKNVSKGEHFSTLNDENKAKVIGRAGQMAHNMAKVRIRTIGTGSAVQTQ